MTGSLLRFEWTYHGRQMATWAFALGFLALGFMLGGLGAFGESELHRNGPWAIAYSMGLLCLGSVFAVMVLAAQGVLRDVTYGMAPIIHATPISERRFLATRFLGVWTSSLWVFSPALLGYWVGTWMPWIDPAQLGSPNLASFLRPLWVLIVPNLLLVSSVLFAVAAASRSRRLTYVGALLIYAFYMAGSVVAGSPLMAGSSPASADSLRWIALLDPFGLAAFLEQGRDWTLEQRNSRSLQLHGTLLWNRLLWTGVSVSILVAVGRVFRFRRLIRKGTLDKAPKKTPREDTSSIAEPGCPASPYRPATVRPEGPGAWLRTLVTRWRLELTLLLRSRPFWLLLLVWLFILAMELLPRTLGGLEYGASLYPTTALLISWFETPLMLVSTLALVFYGGEVAASDRDAHMEGLLDATPASSRARWLAKLLALVALPVLLITVAVAASWIWQSVRSHGQHDVSVYLGVYYFQGVRLGLLAALALAIQAFVGRKYLAMLVTLVAVLSTSGLGARVGLHHPLTRFAAAPTVSYSDMSGYGATAVAFPWYMLYWSAWAVMLLVLADLAGSRAARHAGGRLRAFRRWTVPTAVTLACALVVAVATGTFLWFQSCGVTPCSTRSEELDLRASYERRYKAFEDLPEPTVVAMTAYLDLFPGQRRFRLETHLTLENERDQALEEIFFTLPDGVRLERLEVEGADLTDRDETLGVWWFRWSRPMAPGETRRLTYVLEDQTRPFDLAGSWTDPTVESNGTYLMETFYAPRIGYRSSLEIESDFERRRRGLPAKIATPNGGDHVRLRDDDGHDWLDFEAIVSTDSDQIALAPGRLIRRWQEGGRNVSHFRSDGPMARTVAFASARYEVAGVRHRGVDIEVYHHREHRQNVEYILDLARRSLDDGEAALGPYGRDHLRLVEVPASWSFGGFAMPGTVILPARGTFLVDRRDPRTFDLVAKRVVHEIAHQWWGHRVAPVTAPGSTLLVESLAKYAEWALLDALHGPRQTQELLELEHRRYQEGRASDRELEVPLAQVEDQAYLFYSKGYLAMNALRAELGFEVLDGILRRFAAQWAYPHTAPRAEDWLAALDSHVGPRGRRVVDDWFRRIVHWQVRLRSASTQRLPDGSWETRLEIECRKFETDSQGRVAEVPLDDRIQVGLFASGDVLNPDHRLRLETVHFDRAHTALTLRTPSRPELAGVDPFRVLIDADRTDQLAPVVEE